MQRALESVLSQDYPGEIEAVVVFDACEPFEPPVEVPDGRSVHITVNHRSRGLAGARNTGIVQATHDYVAFLDDDDYWLQGKLSSQMRCFAEAAAPPVLVGSAMVLDDGSNTHERLVPKDVVEHADLLRDRMVGLHPSTFVFRKEALLGPVGLVDEALPGSYGEDYDLLLRTALVAPIPVINRPLVSVTWSRDSLFFGRWGAYADGLEYLLATHPGFREDRKAFGRIASQIAFARAGNGERRAGASWAARALRRDPLQVKAWLALGVAARLWSADAISRLVQRMGKGI